MSLASVKVHRWSRAEYERMATAGVFHPQARLELVNGEIYEMAPQTSRHAACVALIQETLRSVLPAGCHMRVQLPLALGDDSEPEPDIAVVAGGPRDYLDLHPGGAELVIEVADSSLAYDRQHKGGLYARAGIPDYWIVDLVHRTVEIYRDPVQGKYQEHSVLKDTDSTTPSVFSEVCIPVRDLLP